MVLSLNDLHFRLQCRIIQCSSDLADTTADTVYYLTIFIGCRCLVAIFKSKRLKAFVTGDHLSRHKHTAVDLSRTNCKVGGTCRAAAGKVSGTGS